LKIHVASRRLLFIARSAGEGEVTAIPPSDALTDPRRRKEHRRGRGKRRPEERSDFGSDRTAILASGSSSEIKRKTEEPLAGSSIALDNYASFRSAAPGTKERSQEREESGKQCRRCDIRGRGSPGTNKRPHVWKKGEDCREGGEIDPRRGHRGNF